MGNVRSSGGRISHPTSVAKTTGGVLTAADLVSGYIVADANAGLLTLSIPNVETILAAFELNGQTMAAGDQFEVTFVRGVNGAGNLAIDAAAAAPVTNHAVTWATGLAPIALTAAAGAASHVCKLIFEVTSLLTPSIRIHSIVG